MMIVKPKSLFVIAFVFVYDDLFAIKKNFSNAELKKFHFSEKDQPN